MFFPLSPIPYNIYSQDEKFETKILKYLTRAQLFVLKAQVFFLRYSTVSHTRKAIINAQAQRNSLITNRKNQASSIPLLERLRASASID